MAAPTLRPSGATQRDYAAMVRDMDVRLSRLARRLAQGQISPDQWADGVDAVLFEAHTQARVLGRQRGGDLDPRNELDELAGLDAKDAQGEFLRGFLDDIQAGRYTDEEGIRSGPIHSRSRLYLGNTRATANEAMLDASDPDEEWDWKLGPAEHCEDCKELAALGSYTRDTIISVPGDGQTACLTNCHCVLVRRSDGLRGFERPALDAPGTALDAGDGEGRAPTETEKARAKQEVGQVAAHVRDVLGMGSRWNGFDPDYKGEPVLVEAGDRWRGKKAHTSNIVVNEAIVNDPIRWRTYIHEVVHASSEGYSALAYQQHMGWEEAVVEGVQRLIRSEVLSAAGIEYDEEAHRAYERGQDYTPGVEAIGAVADAAGVPRRDLFMRLLRTPLAEREAELGKLVASAEGPRKRQVILALAAARNAVRSTP